MCLKNKSYSFNMSALQAAHLGVCCNKHRVDYSMIKSFRTAGTFLFAECKMCWFSWPAQRGLCYSGSFTIKLKLILVRASDLQLRCHMYTKEKLCSADWVLRVSIILLALVLLWGASCSNKMASRWARKTCCLLLSAVSITLRPLFNIFGIFSSISNTR